VTGDLVSLRNTTKDRRALAAGFLSIQDKEWRISRRAEWPDQARIAGNSQIPTVEKYPAAARPVDLNPLFTAITFTFQR
jgi:hypothetical protein